MRACHRRADKGTYRRYMSSLALFACINRNEMYSVALFTSGPPVYSWKHCSSGTLRPISPSENDKEKSDRLLTLGNLSRKMSILFKNKIIDVLRNNRELTTPSKRASDSAIRFWKEEPPCEVTIRKRVWARHTRPVLRRSRLVRYRK